MPESRRHRSSSTRLPGKPVKGKAKPGPQKANRKTGLHGKTGDTALVAKTGKKGTQKFKALGAGGSKDAGASGMHKATGARKRETTSVKMRAVGKASVGKAHAKSSAAKSKTTSKAGSDRKKQKGGETSVHAGVVAVAGERADRGRSQDSGKRKRKARMSLALEFTVPVCMMLGLIIVIWGIVIRRHMQKNHLNEIKKNGASQVLALAKIGSRILKDKEDSNDLWLLKGGWVSKGKWEKLTGKKGEEKPSAADIAKANHNARVLSSLTFYVDPQKRNEILDAYVLGEGNKFVAGAYEFKGQVLIKSSSWFHEVEQNVKIGDDFRSLGDVKVSPSVVDTGGKSVKAFQFRCPIRNADGLTVGTALLALRGEVIETEQSALSRLMIMMGIGAMVLAIVVCVLIATVVTKPVKTLIKDMEIVSQGNLEHKTRAHSSDEIGQMAVEFNEMTRKLLVARDAEKEAERLENELDMAREIQMTLLPKGVPKVDGFDIEAHYRPAKEVGGDYYDFYLIVTKIHLGIIVADVSGKSVPGAMQMATTRTILRFIAGNNTSAMDTLAKTNAIVAQEIKRGMFVTAFYVVLDAKNKSALCASAGHNPMVLVRANGELELINPSGIALGFDKGPIFSRTIKEQRVQLATGDRVVLYTDGVVEAMNSKNEEYTPERFYEFCKKNTNQSSKDFVAGLLDDLDAHKGKAEQHDDITVVTFKVL